ncbi:response regulator [Agathobaculum sp. Marseille-P7918]|uniref:response regulator n=1 Tax=Agathobaculum sp. Marseille-P7918 TaxID=2479843 RepID=UPI0035663518
MYTAVIIEDDPIITRLNARYIDQDHRFTVVKTFSSANPALVYLQNHAVDLIVLDVFMPQMNGSELLHILRVKGVNADVIMVTSANDAETVQTMMRLGVIDYLVKPFAYERFQLALEHFCQRREAIQNGTINQGLLDRALFSDTHGNLSAVSSTPPKGLQAQTLERIKRYLRSKPEEKHTSDDIASHVGLSVVTVRRYMNYLSEQNIVESEMDYSTGGRPCIVYRSLPEPG